MLVRPVVRFVQTIKRVTGVSLPVTNECGNTGVCVSGACQQQPASKACGAAQSCSGTTYQPPSHCTGTGTCNQLATQKYLIDLKLHHVPVYVISFGDLASLNRAHLVRRRP